jgi:hypothetical protein
MATLYSNTNIIVLQAAGDTARTTQKVRIGSVQIVGNSLTAAPSWKLVNGASSAILVPSGKAKSGAGIFDIHFDYKYPREVVGLKATSCANCSIVVNLI